MKYLIGLVVFFLMLSSVSALEESDVHDIDILSIFISDHDLSCSQYVDVHVQVWNSGEVLEQISVELVQDDLGVLELSDIVMLDAGDSHTFVFSFEFEEEPKGEYMFDTFFMYGPFVKNVPKSFVFQGCIEEVQPVFQYENSKSEKNNAEQLSPSLSLLITTMLVIIILLLVVGLLLHRIGSEA